MSKRCCRCKQIKQETDFRRDRSRSDGLQHRCRDCQIAVNREWAERNPEVRRAALRRQSERSKRNRGGSRTQRACHNAVARGIAKGTVSRPCACPSCGASDSPIQAHHDDYQQPLAIEWLCSRCHGRLHAARRASA